MEPITIATAIATIFFTKALQNKPACESEGWTIVLMQRGSRFLWELHCGRKDKQKA